METKIIKLIGAIKELDLDENDTRYFELWNAVLDLIGISEDNINDKWYNAENDCYECITTHELTAEQLYNDLIRFKKKHYK